MHLPWVSLKERKKRLACATLARFEFPQFFPSLILQHLCWGSADMLVLQAVPNRAWETENATTPASTREDIVGLVRKVALLEGELAEPHRAREAVEEKFCNLFDMSANGMQ
jgi:hypothetical protein